MPDRFDLSGIADLGASLRLADEFCQLASINQLAVDQRHQLQSARTYLTDQREAIEQWLASSLTHLNATAIIPRPAPLPFETTQELRDFGNIIKEMTPATLALAARKDSVYALAPYDGHIMGKDFAAHLVRVICAATIDRGWAYPTSTPESS